MMAKFKYSPIYTFILLIFVTIALSGVLSLLNVQAEYTTVNPVTSELSNSNIVQVENLFSLSGLKYIASNAVTSFVSFAPLSMLIIVLIGIGVLEKTGFIKLVFTIITQSFKKNTLTFLLILFSILSSFFGNIGFVVLLPLGALLFKYGHRNPLGGIIASFAGITFGYGINIFLSSIDSSILTMTLDASYLLDPKYSIGAFFGLFIMILALIIMSIVFTRITERTVMPKLGKYEFEELETLEDKRFSNRELRGLIISIGVGIIYLLLIVYMIIPGLPLSGALLDNDAALYVDKLLGKESLFSQSFIFIITFFFILIGLVYGFVSKSIKSNKEVTESLAYSLDGIGNIIVLIFVSSLFISIFKKTNIGLVLTASLSNLINSVSFTGIGLIIMLFIIAIVCGLFYSGLAMKWHILSGVVVPVFMNASLSPELAQITYMAGSSVSMGLTPILAYFVIYIAFLEKYNKSDTITLFGSMKYLVPYSLATFVIWFILLVGFFITGLPLGIGSMPSVVF